LLHPAKQNRRWRWEEFGGGEWTRTTDLRIMSRPTGADSKEVQQDESADSGKVLQNPQPRRNKAEQKKGD